MCEPRPHELRTVRPIRITEADRLSALAREAGGPRRLPGRPRPARPHAATGCGQVLEVGSVHADRSAVERRGQRDDGDATASQAAAGPSSSRVVDHVRTGGWGTDQRRADLRHRTARDSTVPMLLRGMPAAAPRRRARTAGLGGSAIRRRSNSRTLQPTARLESERPSETDANVPPCASCRRSSRSTTTWSSRPTVWTDRLPAKYHDIGPRIVRAPVKEMTFIGGKFTAVPGEPGRPGRTGRLVVLRGPAPAAHPPRHRRRLRPRRDHAQGHHLRRDAPGSYAVPERLADMDINHVEASLCFPTFPRFCGQTFTEASDKELALLCVQAYNDWMVEEWCGPSGGRLIPLTLIPLWDPALAAAEVRRNADRGVHAVCFSEIPPNLGLPVDPRHGRLLAPVLRGLQRDRHDDQHAHRLGLEDAVDVGRRPACGRLDAHLRQLLLLDGRLADERAVRRQFPDLKIVYSEGQIGWIPYILERADMVWRRTAAGAASPTRCSQPPSRAVPRPRLRLLLRRRPRPALDRRDRRRQRHLRDRLPALRLDLAAHGRRSPRSRRRTCPTTSSTRCSAATRSRCCRSRISRDDHRSRSILGLRSLSDTGCPPNGARIGGTWPLRTETSVGARRVATS